MQGSQFQPRISIPMCNACNIATKVYKEAVKPAKDIYDKDKAQLAHRGLLGREFWDAEAVIYQTFKVSTQSFDYTYDNILNQCKDT